VAKSQSQQPKSHFPSLKIDQSQFPFDPFRTLIKRTVESCCTLCVSTAKRVRPCKPGSLETVQPCKQ
jgi:hypothetical protein